MNSCVAKASSAVVTVGGGRGFIIGNYIITAAHCLPFFPPCMSFSDVHERTFKDLLAPLGRNPTVWAECPFVDPIGDIAVLGEPDGSADLYQESMDYRTLVEDESVARIDIESAGNEGWLLSLDGDWFNCGIEQVPAGFPMWLNLPAGKIVAGMSGSPVISATGAAVGVVCNSSESQAATVHLHGPQPALLQNLPGWFRHKIKGRAMVRRKTKTLSRV
ncbi:MAG: hypothetical protein ACT4O2_12650 [Beijerinckiaceae bacterium]